MIRAGKSGEQDKSRLGLATQKLKTNIDDDCLREPEEEEEAEEEEEGAEEERRMRLCSGFAAFDGHFLGHSICSIQWRWHCIGWQRIVIT